MSEQEQRRCTVYNCPNMATERCCACHCSLCLSHLYGFIDRPKPEHGGRGRCPDCDYEGYRNTYGGM